MVFIFAESSNLHMKNFNSSYYTLDALTSYQSTHFKAHHNCLSHLNTFLSHTHFICNLDDLFTGTYGGWWRWLFHLTGLSIKLWESLGGWGLAFDRSHILTWLSIYNYLSQFIPWDVQLNYRLWSSNCWLSVLRKFTVIWLCLINCFKRFSFLDLNRFGFFWLLEFRLNLLTLSRFFQLFLIGLLRCLCLSKFIFCLLFYFIYFLLLRYFRSIIRLLLTTLLILGYFLWLSYFLYFFYFYSVFIFTFIFRNLFIFIWDVLCFSSRFTLITWLRGSFLRFVLLCFILSRDFNLFLLLLRFGYLLVNLNFFKKVCERGSCSFGTSGCSNCSNSIYRAFLGLKFVVFTDGRIGSVMLKALCCYLCLPDDFIYKGIESCLFWAILL